MQLSDLNWALVVPILAIQLILIIFALIDLLKAERVNGPKWLWVLIVVIISFFGPILYFIFGKKQT